MKFTEMHSYNLNLPLIMQYFKK